MEIKVSTTMLIFEKSAYFASHSRVFLQFLESFDLWLQLVITDSLKSYFLPIVQDVSTFQRLRTHSRETYNNVRCRVSVLVSVVLRSVKLHNHDQMYWKFYSRKKRKLVTFGLENVPFPVNDHHNMSCLMYNIKS